MVKQAGDSSAQLDSHPHVESVSAVSCCFSREYYALQQNVALVRHADRLDQTPEWRTCAERELYPSDTPLTAIGHAHARETGEALLKFSEATQRPFSLIVSSPYLRCAQTASEIAQVLNLPIQFDLDMGEVFDDEVSGDGNPVHRSPEVLEAVLREEFKDVEYSREESNMLQVRGKQPSYPESLPAARLRYAYKFQELANQAAAKLSSIVIVSHADGLAAVASLMKPDSIVKSIPYTAYLIASRKVNVFDKRARKWLSSQPVYGNHARWELELSPGFQCDVAPSTEVEAYKNKRRQDKHLLKEKQPDLIHITSANSLTSLTPADVHKELTKSLMSHGSSRKQAEWLVAVSFKSHFFEQPLARLSEAMSEAMSHISSDPPQSESSQTKLSTQEAKTADAPTHTVATV